MSNRQQVLQDTPIPTLRQAIRHRVSAMEQRELVSLAISLGVSVPVPSAANVPAKVRRFRWRGAPPTRLQPAPESARTLQGTGAGPVVSAPAGARRLDAITFDDDSADWAASELLGAGELVRRLGIARGTLDNWRRAARIVAFRKGLRNFLYPARQFEGLQPVAGLERVLPLFASTEDAWEWLVAPNRMTEDRPPVEALRRGDTEAVVRAAQGAADYA